MLSVIMCSRLKDNSDSNMPLFLKSLNASLLNDEVRKVEVLIKTDRDDEHRPDLSDIHKYNFPIKVITTSRNEGRLSLHQAYQYLFTRKSLHSKYVMIASDDFVFIRQGFVSDILSIKDSYSIVGDGNKNVAYLLGYKCPVGFQTPIYSTALLEVCQNFGWTSNVDIWAMMLIGIMRKDYAIDINHSIAGFAARNEQANVQDHSCYTEVIEDYDYLLKLVRQQAKNLYLNIAHQNKDKLKML